MKFVRAAVMQISEKSLTAILDGITQPRVKVQAKGRGGYRVQIVQIACPEYVEGVNRFAPFKPFKSPAVHLFKLFKSLR
jgi:hypothetical protein